MSDAHLALYQHHTGRSELPLRPARYAELVVGRRGGKNRILALIATYLACVLAELMRLSNGVVVQVRTASIGAPRGRTFLAVLALER